MLLSAFARTRLLQPLTAQRDKVNLDYRPGTPSERPGLPEHRDRGQLCAPPSRSLTLREGLSLLGSERRNPLGLGVGSCRREGRSAGLSSPSLAPASHRADSGPLLIRCSNQLWDLRASVVVSSLSILFLLIFPLYLSRL